MLPWMGMSKIAFYLDFHYNYTLLHTIGSVILHFSKTPRPLASTSDKKPLKKGIKHRQEMNISFKNIYFKRTGEEVVPSRSFDCPLFSDKLSFF